MLVEDQPPPPSVLGKLLVFFLHQRLPVFQILRPIVCADRFGKDVSDTQNLREKMTGFPAVAHHQLARANSSITD